MKLDNLKKEFTNYVKTFNVKEFNIRLKWKHSFRVMKNSLKIAKDLNLNEEDTILAGIIGLLHDYGRFEQWKNYKTFSDHKSIDHATLGNKLLFEDMHIKKFDINEKYYKIIKLAIEFHNKKQIDESSFIINGKLNEQALVHAKIIRDADKLDIFYFLHVDEKHKKYNNQVSQIVTQSILEEFNKQTSATVKNVKNAIDRSLALLCFTYDFNFGRSLKQFKKLKYGNKIYNLFEDKLDENNKKVLKDCVNKINNYVDSKIA